MPEFLHQVAVQDKSVAADGVEVFDLAVNPLSVVLLNIRPLNDTGTLADFCRAMAIAGSLNAIRVLHRGASVFSMSGRDAIAHNFFRYGMLPFEANGDNTNDERRCLQIPILLGRHAYDSDSCFPATVRGELTMELDIDVADTGYNGFRYSVETIELLDVSPTHYERKISIARTLPATGANDILLPNGNVVRGLLLFGTTPFAGATPAPSWGRISLMKDNQQIGFASTDFESLHQIGQLFGRQPPTGQSHKHLLGGTGAANDPTTDPYGEGDGDGWNQYAFMDLDPTRDDAFSIDTTGSSNWLLRCDAETADAVRVVQIERVNV